MAHAYHKSLAAAVGAMTLAAIIPASPCSASDSSTDGYLTCVSSAVTPDGKGWSGENNRPCVVR